MKTSGNDGLQNLRDNCREQQQQQQEEEKQMTTDALPPLFIRNDGGGGQTSLPSSVDVNEETTERATAGRQQPTGMMGDDSGAAQATEADTGADTGEGHCGINRHHGSQQERRRCQALILTSTNDDFCMAMVSNSHEGGDVSVDVKP